MKRFIQEIFGHQEITPDIIREYFSIPRRESSTLEFKTGEKKIEGVCNEIIAFLNTNGGLVVYGAPKDVVSAEDKNIKYTIGEPIPVVEFKNEERLTAIILNQIIPQPVGLNILQVKMDGSSGYVYLIEVPKSEYMPHHHKETGVHYFRSSSITKPAVGEVLRKMLEKSSNHAQNINTEAVNKTQLSPPLECYLQPVERDYLSVSYDVILFNRNLEMANEFGFHVSIQSKQGVIRSLKLPEKRAVETFNPIGLTIHNFQVPQCIPNFLVHNQAFKYRLKINFKNLGHILIQIGFFYKHSEMIQKCFIINLRDPFNIVKDFTRTNKDQNASNEIERYLSYLQNEILKETLTPPPVPPPFS